MIKKLKSKNLLIVVLLAIGFLVRIFLIPNGNKGDITAFAEWGQKYWEVGAKDFYFSENWYYTFPTYPPLANLMYAGTYWLFEHNYVMAQIHNIVKVIPAAFIIYFNKIVSESPFMYREGYFLLLKLPSILADLALAAVIYKLVLQLTKNYKKALVGFSLLLFNPASIFVSSVWGQNESLVALFSLTSFVLLVKKKIWLSAPLFFISLYLKPTALVFVPLFIFSLYLIRPRFSGVLVGVVLSLIVFWLTTSPFKGQLGIFEFTRKIAAENIHPYIKGTARASVSAFNFHTIFLKIDRNFAEDKLFGIQANSLGITIYIALNLFVFSYLKKQKKLLFPMITSLFIIAMGSFLFMTNMLERYFFNALAPMVIVMFVSFKTFIYAFLINLVSFANLIWAFYRRGLDEIDHFFTNYNFLFIRALSLTSVLSFLMIFRRLYKKG